MFGDVIRYATVGDRRITGIEASDEALSFDVIGVPHTWVKPTDTRPSRRVR